MVANDMNSFITTAEWKSGKLWWSVSRWYCSWEQAYKPFQVVPLTFCVFSSLFNSCNKLSWRKLYVSIVIATKMHSNIEDDILNFFFLLKVDCTWQYLMWNIVEMGIVTFTCRQKPKHSLRASSHSALIQINSFPCCLLFVSLPLLP